MNWHRRSAFDSAARRASQRRRRERHYTWDVGDRLRMVFDSQYGTARYTHDRLGSLAVAAYDEGVPKELACRAVHAVAAVFRSEEVAHGMARVLQRTRRREWRGGIR